MGLQNEEWTYLCVCTCVCVCVYACVCVYCGWFGKRLTVTRKINGGNDRQQNNQLLAILEDEQTKEAEREVRMSDVYQQKDKVCVYMCMCVCMCVCV